MHNCALPNICTLSQGWSGLRCTAGKCQTTIYHRQVIHILRLPQHLMCCVKFISVSLSLIYLQHRSGLSDLSLVGSFRGASPNVSSFLGWWVKCHFCPGDRCFFFSTPEDCDSRSNVKQSIEMQGNEAWCEFAFDLCGEMLPWRPRVEGVVRVLVESGSLEVVGLEMFMEEKRLEV